MQLRELFESVSQHTARVFIEKECKKLEYIIEYYDNYVAGQGRQSAEADWFYIPVINSLPKLQKAYAKLQQLRQQLEDKIKSGI